MLDLKGMLDARTVEIRRLSDESQGSTQWFEAASLALSLLHDTTGGAHPLAATLRGALDKADFYHAAAGARAVAKLYESGGLSSPRLAIAHELEGDLLEIAQQQVQRAEKTSESDTRRVHLGIAAFLAGAALEDCLRRLCDAHHLAYDPHNTSLAKYHVP